MSSISQAQTRWSSASSKERFASARILTAVCATFESEWAQVGSNHRPPACEAGDLRSPCEGFSRAPDSRSPAFPPPKREPPKSFIDDVDLEPALCGLKRRQWRGPSFGSFSCGWFAHGRAADQFPLARSRGCEGKGAKTKTLRNEAVPKSVPKFVRRRLPRKQKAAFEAVAQSLGVGLSTVCGWADADWWRPRRGSWSSEAGASAS